MKNKIMSSICLFGLALLTLIIVGIGVYLWPLSQEVALANPTLTHMRIPVLITGWLVLAFIISLIVVAFLLLVRISRDKTFEQESVNLLKTMSFLSIGPIPVLIFLYFYTEANVAGSITNLYVMFGGVAFAILSIFFFLLSSVFQKAVDYKTDTDLTI